MTETGNITRKDNTKLHMFFFVSNCYKHYQYVSRTGFLNFYYKLKHPNLRSCSPCRKKIRCNSAILLPISIFQSLARFTSGVVRFLSSALGKDAMLHYQVSCMSHKQSIAHSYRHKSCN